MLSSNKNIADLLAIALTHYEFLTLNEKQIIQKKLDNLHDLALLSIEEISLSVGRVFSSKTRIPQDIQNTVEKDLTLMRSYSIGVVFYDDAAYPPLLKEIFDPPFALFYRGNKNVLCSSCIAVVGTRRPTGNGMKSAFEFSKECCGLDLTIVSGLAHGIDTFAHKGAVEGIVNAQKGSSIAVLASGLDSIYPAENRKIAASIIQTGGCLVSEYPPGIPPLKWHFPQRNRIISGLSEACVVIEAPAGSGALITADFALEQNRDLFFHEAALEYKYVKPLVVKNKMSPAKYIEEGARVIHSAEDMIDKMQNPCVDNSTTTGLHFNQLKLDLQ